MGGGGAIKTKGMNELRSLLCWSCLSSIYTGSWPCGSEVENLPSWSEALRSVPRKMFFPNHVVGVIYAIKNHRQGLP